ncbi:carboxylic ester hydrolase [soil metagenome]
MSILDIILLVGIVGVAVWRIIAGRNAPRPLRLAPLALAALALIQLVAEGYYWQLIPAWLVIAVLGLLSLRKPDPTAKRRPILRLFGQAVLLGLVGLVLAPWTFLPVPAMIRPDGPYAVGSEIFRWTDASRPEPATNDPADRRSVIVQAWYPAQPNSRLTGPVYMDGLEDLPKTVSILPRFMLRHFNRIDTHASLEAPVSAKQQTWPVILFSPGYGAPRASYTSLVTRLASRGYVVLAIDHPYEAAVTRLPNGRVAAMVEHRLPNDPDMTNFMIAHLETRVADADFVLDQMAKPFGLGPRLSSRADSNRVAIIGHSFGGATAAAAMGQDPRVKAAVNLDGTYYGAIPVRPLDRPFMVVQSDYAETHHSRTFIDGNNQLLANSEAAGAWRYEVHQANHYSFTDLPLFLSPPGRLALSWLIGGSRGPDQTQKAAADLITAFLQGPFGGPPADMAAAAKPYPWITGGPVR